MVAFTYRMPAGIAGDVNRVFAATIEAQNTLSTAAPTAYGLPVVSDGASSMRAFASTDTAIYGLIARPYPTQSSQDPLVTSTPPTAGPMNVLVRGYMTVLLQGTTAATKGGKVYLWTGSTSTSHPVIGAFEAATSTAGTVYVSNAYFMGPADSNSFCEVAFNI